MSAYHAKREHRHPDAYDHAIYDVSHKYNISILPMTPDFDLDNLYSSTEMVGMWNTLIVGNDKTYILADIKDPHIRIPRIDRLLNKRGEQVLPNELVMLFDSLWNKTLSGKQLQFYMVWNGRLYFINTYPFSNGRGKVIGAVLFMRAYDRVKGSRASLEMVNISDSARRPMSMPMFLPTAREGTGEEAGYFSTKGRPPASVTTSVADTSESSTHDLRQQLQPQQPQPQQPRPQQPLRPIPRNPAGIAAGTSGLANGTGTLTMFLGGG